MSIRTEQFPTDESAPQAPPDVTWLRKARERSGVTLDQLSQATKIRRGYLDALEAGEVDKLPAAFYTRGFLRSYASVIGLDPEHTADRYCGEMGFVRPTDAENVAAIVETAVGRTGVTGFDKHYAPLIKSLHPDPSRRLVIAAAVVGAAMYVGPSSWHGWVSKVGASTTVSASAPAAMTITAPITAPMAAPAPAVTPVAAAAAPVSDQPAGALKFAITPKGDCWFSAAADGTEGQSGLLKSGDQRAIEVREALVLRVGDPGACTFSINGHAGRPLGTAGIPVTVRMTKDNYKEFLGS